MGRLVHSSWKKFVVPPLGGSSQQDCGVIYSTNFRLKAGLRTSRGAGHQLSCPRRMPERTARAWLREPNESQACSARSEVQAQPGTAPARSVAALPEMLPA